MAWKIGTQLSEQDQARAIERWSRTPQFHTDRDWLDSTRFRVNGKGRLDGRARNCYPTPTIEMLIPVQGEDLLH